MRKCHVVAGMVGLLGWALSARAGLLDFFLGRHDLQVITVTDMTPAGRLQPAATPQTPVYYMAVNFGFRDFGGSIAGDKVPPKDEVLRSIAKALAVQGYVPATDRSPPPTLLLLLTWGTLYADYDYGPNPDLPPRQLNRQQILKFLGGYKMGFSDSDFDPLAPTLTGLTLMRHDSRDFYDAASDDYYVTVVAAYDLKALKAKKKELLWTTRISCPSRGFWLQDVMPAMLAIGSPSFGKESTQPQWVNASDRFKPEVRLGDLKLLEYIDNGKLPVIDESTNKATSVKKKPVPRNR